MRLFLPLLLLAGLAAGAPEACTPGENAGSPSLPSPSPDSGEDEVRIRLLDEGDTVPPGLRSFSVVSAYRKHPTDRTMLAEVPEGVELVRRLKPYALRFPGGSFARKFKPFEPRYARLIDAHIGLSRAAGVMNTILVLNFLDGTEEEALHVIRRFEEAGIRIVAVELGNEIHLKKYRQAVPDVETFVDKIRRYREALRPVLPDAGFGLPVASAKHVFDAEQMGARADFFEHWNGTLAAAVRDGTLDVDAVIPHFYKQTHTVYDRPSLEDRFDGVMDELRIDSYEFLDKAVLNYYDSLFGGVDMWITEWGLKEKQVYGNTLAEGLHVTGFVLDLTRANARLGDRIPFACYQKLHGRISNGAISEVGTRPEVEPAEAYRGETAWYAFRFLAEALDGSIRMESETEGAPRSEVRIEAFRRGDDLFVVFANRTGRTIRTDLAGRIACMTGDHPWSTNGQTFWTEAEDRFAPVELIEDRITNEIPPYAFGYLRTSWDAANNR